MPRCRRAIYLWSESLDRRLSLLVRLETWLHWMLCPPCRRYVKQADACRKAAARLLNENPEANPAESSLGLSPECRARILQAMKDAQGNG